MSVLKTIARKGHILSCAKAKIIMTQHLNMLRVRGLQNLKKNDVKLSLVFTLSSYNVVSNRYFLNPFCASVFMVTTKNPYIKIAKYILHSISVCSCVWFISIVVVFPFSSRRSPRTAAERIHSRGTGRRASDQWFISTIFSNFLFTTKRGRGEQGCRFL